MVTARTDCPTCGNRVIEARIGGGLKVTLNYDPAPEGNVAAKCEASGAWTARHLPADLALRPPEKRFVRHWVVSPGCAPEAAQQQRDAAQDTTSFLAEYRNALAAKARAKRNQRGKHRGAAQPYLGFRRTP